MGGQMPTGSRVEAAGRNGGVSWGSPSSRLSLSRPGTAASPSWVVNGVLGGSVLLAPALPPNKTVKKIEWSFSDGSGATIQVAEFSPGGFKRPDPKDRFENRLEMLNATVLKIGALEWGDSGVYQARIQLYPALLQDQSFSLAVYGPVPTPEIEHQLLSLTAEGCNVTLQCWVPAGSDAETIWQLNTSLEMPCGQVCEGNRTLSLAMPTSAFNTSYTCVARNPIEERSVSIHLGTLCRQQETRVWQRWYVCHVLLAVGGGALLGLVCLWRKKRRKKAAKGATLASPSREDAPLEPAYAEIQRTSLEADTWQQDHPTTIYSQVQAGTGSPAEPLA